MSEGLSAGTHIPGDLYTIIIRMLWLQLIHTTDFLVMQCYYISLSKMSKKVSIAYFKKMHSSYHLGIWDNMLDLISDCKFYDSHI